MFIPFPKIPSLRNLIGSMSREEGFESAGMMTFVGRPKIHGTNAGITLTPSGQLLPQSRNRALTLGNDNMKFASWVKQNEEELGSTLYHGLLGPVLPLAWPQDESITVWGEWAGPGVQRGVAVSRLSHRMFFPFAYKVGEEKLRPTRAFEHELMHSVEFFGAETVRFNPATNEGLQEAVDRIQELTDAYEAKCPVAAHFGIEGMGEGLVWWDHHNHWLFKSKGEKHQQVRKPLPTPPDPEEAGRALAFAERVVTPARMEGAYSWLKEMNHPLDQTSTGALIRYVLEDVRAECIEEFKEAQASWKLCGGQISRLVRQYFFEVV